MQHEYFDFFTASLDTMVRALPSSPQGKSQYLEAMILHGRTDALEAMLHPDTLSCAVLSEPQWHALLDTMRITPERIARADEQASDAWKHVRAYLEAHPGFIVPHDVIPNYQEEYARYMALVINPHVEKSMKWLLQSDQAHVIGGMHQAFTYVFTHDIKVFVGAALEPTFAGKALHPVMKTHLRDLLGLAARSKAIEVIILVFEAKRLCTEIKVCWNHVFHCALQANDPHYPFASLMNVVDVILPSSHNAELIMAFVHRGMELSVRQGYLGSLAALMQASPDGMPCVAEAFVHACKYGSVETLDAFLQPACMQRFDLSQACSDGRHALDVAVFNRNHAMIARLLDEKNNGLSFSINLSFFIAFVNQDIDALHALSSYASVSFPMRIDFTRRNDHEERVMVFASAKVWVEQNCDVNDVTDDSARFMHACLMCFREEDQTVALRALKTHHSDLWCAVMALRPQTMKLETTLQTASMFGAKALPDSQQDARPM